MMLERSKADSGSKMALRQLKNQLEDAECARAIAVKAKQALEQDLTETQLAHEEAIRARSEAEDRANLANRERAELISQLEENEEELAEVCNLPLLSIPSFFFFVQLFLMNIIKHLDTIV